MVKAVIGIVVIIALGAGAYYWYNSMQPAPQEPVAITTPSTTTAAPSPGAATAVGASGQTDAALSGDAATIDAAMQSFSSDNAEVNASLSDQAEPQSSL